MWHDCSTVLSTIIQQSMAQFFNCRCYNCSAVTGTIVQLLLAWFFICQWHDSQTVNVISLFTVLAWFDSSIWYSLLGNCVMYQEYDTWSNSGFKRNFPSSPKNYPAESCPWKVVPQENYLLHNQKIKRKVGLKTFWWDTVLDRFSMKEKLPESIAYCQRSIHNRTEA